MEKLESVPAFIDSEFLTELYLPKYLVIQQVTECLAVCYTS